MRYLCLTYQQRKYILRWRSKGLAAGSAPSGGASTLASRRVVTLLRDTTGSGILISTLIKGLHPEPMAFQIPTISSSRKPLRGRLCDTNIRRVSATTAHRRFASNHTCVQLPRLVRKGMMLLPRERRLVGKSPTTKPSIPNCQVLIPGYLISKRWVWCRIHFVYYSLGGTSCVSKIWYCQSRDQIPWVLYNRMPAMILYVTVVQLFWCYPAHVPCGALGTWTIENQPDGYNTRFFWIFIIHSLYCTTSAYQYNLYTRFYLRE